MTTATAPTPSLKERVAEYLARNPRQMTPIMARELGATEAEVLRAHPDDIMTELTVGGEKTGELIRALEAFGRVHVISSNEACTLEAYGYFGGFSVMGPFFNVQTETLDMHIRHHEIASAFALIKPSHQDGQMTYSIQFFATSGRSAFKVFLYKSVTEHDGSEVSKAIAAWEQVRAQFKK